MSLALRFITLTFVLTLPFLAAGQSGLELAPGAPVSALAALCPGVAAILLSGRGVLARIGEAMRRRPRPIWFGVALLLPAVLVVASYAIAEAAGANLPAPSIAPEALTVLVLATLCLAATEEIGWSFTLLPALVPRLGTLAAALVIGGVWALWHVTALLQAGRGTDWIAWWALGTVASRVILVWLYQASGAALSVPILYHAVINVAWQVYPVRGSFYDPRVTSMLTALVALGVVIVTRGRLRSAGRPRAN